MKLSSAAQLVASAMSMATLVDAVPTAEYGTAERCVTPPGTFEIDQFMLYPENSDFDFESCLLYLGSIYNASISVYNPATKKTSIIEVPGITHNPAVEIGAVAKNPYNGLLEFVANTPVAFSSLGKDLTGTNIYMNYNLATKKFSAPLNLTALVSKGRYSGFQDIEFDAQGHSYVLGTYPGSIVRIENNGKTAKEWYLSPLATDVYGFGGLVTAGNWLITNDNNPPRLLKFDMRASKGTPVEIPIASKRNISEVLSGSDAVLLPKKYKGTVMLVSMDIYSINGVVVLRSKDGKWNEAEDLGTILNDKVPGGFAPATVQIGEKIFFVEEFFTDAEKTRSKFPLVDITAEIEKLVGA